MAKVMLIQTYIIKSNTRFCHKNENVNNIHLSIDEEAVRELHCRDVNGNMSNAVSSSVARLYRAPIYFKLKLYSSANPSVGETIQCEISPWDRSED